jgi:hypothetical protein
MSKNTPKLIIQFSGWILMRIPTDPDPTDEPRGVSGYTFAFGNEPDLNREIYFWETDIYKARSHTFPIGVHVQSAVRMDGDTITPIPALEGARVDLLKDAKTKIGPRLENRNWTLTAAGFEPIVPFNFRIKGKGITLLRSAPLVDPQNPAEQQDKPVWKLSGSLLEDYGAVGVLYEPATIGNAIGIWDSAQIAIDRLKLLENDLHELEKKGKTKKLTGDEVVAKVIIAARIKELKFAVENQKDRRIMARYYVERFNFPMFGVTAVTGDQQNTLGGNVLFDTKHPWSIGFWIGAWDPDALSAYVLGALEIPYAS